MTQSFIRECFAMLETEDFKKEIQIILRPIIDIILQEIQPYIYMTIIFICMCTLHISIYIEIYGILTLVTLYPLV